MEMSEGLGVEEWRGVGIGRVLDGGAVVGWIPGVRGVLRTCGGHVHEFVECAGDVAWHGDVDGAGGVVPFEGEAAIEGAGPVGGDGVLCLESVDEMLCVFGADVFDAEVVDDECESDWSSGVAEETRRVFCGGVAVLGEMFLEAVVGENAGLRKAVHAFANLDHYHVVVDEVGKCILLHDVVGNILHGDPHVFVLFHGCAEIEVLDVDGHVASAGSGDDTVEMEFDGGEIGGGSRDFAVVDDLVAADGKSDAVHVGFVGFECSDDAKVRRDAIIWFVSVLDEMHCV